MTKRLLFSPNQAVKLHQMSLIYSILELWALESRDFSQAEKKITVVKAEQILKMENIFTKNGQKLSF